MKVFNLPDVGEGLTEAEIVSWKVKPGDAVKVNDIIVEIETAKSLVELPCPFAGTVAELLAPEGETVEVGSPIITVSVGGAPAAAPTEDVVPTAKEDQAVEPGLIGGPAPGGRTSVLVGYGPRTTEAKRRPRKGAAVPGGAAAAASQAGVHAAFQTDKEPGAEVPAAAAPPALPMVEQPPAPQTVAAVGTKPLAKPPVRKLAKDLGVDLGAITPTGEGGTVTRGDVEAYAAGAAEPAAPAAAEPVEAGFMEAGPVEAPAPARAGERETRLPVKGVRKVTAQAMVASAFTVPHATEWVTLDATRTVRLVDSLKSRSEFRDVKVSPLLVVAKAVCLAVRRTPEVNAVWDDERQEIVLKHYVNLGIAAATPRGLIVPNVKGADSMSLRELAEAINGLTATAREGKTQPADTAGGSFTITNVGVFGIDSGTPIINPGESAILLFGAIREQPWVHKGKVRPRWLTTLALSFDHRLVDGEQGSRFLSDVARIVEDPRNALLL
jgi:pyruvate dehydrogenase E2 component (dihydrolipoamide acetyltransferase)